MRKNFVEIFLLASLMLASLVNACSNPIIRNQNGVPTYNFNVVYADYPSDATIINYNLNITNTNNQALNITFTPLSNLLNYVYGTEASLSARETKQVPLQINIGSDDVQGNVEVTGFCNDGLPFPVGIFSVVIDGRGGAVENCLNRVYSCGTPGNCKDLGDKTEFPVCSSDGHKVTWQCSNNQPKSTPSTSCDTACCKSLGGTCKRTVCDIPQPSMNNISLNITNGHGQIRSAMVSLYAPNNSTILNSSNINGYGTLSTTNPIIDLKIDFDSSVLNTLLKNVNITKLSGKSEIVMDSLIPTIPNVRVHKAYKISVPSGFPFTGITLKIKYSGLSVNNEQNLTIYRCGSYNDSTNTCNEQWTNKTTTRVNGFASTELTSFSVYVLGEPQITTTTTTSTTTTTTTESSNNDNSYSGSSYSDGGIYTTTTIRTATTVTECTCNSWSNLACGESPCDQTQMKQQRTCNPSGCNIESQCIVDNSCVTAQQVNETGNEITSQYTGLFVLPDFSQYIYPISGIIILAGAGIAVWKLNGRIKGIFPSYKFSSGKPSKKGHVTVNVESPKYLEVKMKEQPKMEVIKPEEQPKINVESRNKSMEEMRNRALEMDKKIKRK